MSHRWWYTPIANKVNAENTRRISSSFQARSISIRRRLSRRQSACVFSVLKWCIAENTRHGTPSFKARSISIRRRLSRRQSACVFSVLKWCIAENTRHGTPSFKARSISICRHLSRGQSACVFSVLKRVCRRGKYAAHILFNDLCCHTDGGTENFYENYKH